ncbi:MAG: hypothetical protein RL885_33405 [Planctomycetota bacterium]
MPIDDLRHETLLARRGDVVTGTIEENLRLWRRGVSFESMREALEDTGLWEAIQGLSDGIRSRLNASGHPLSETQADLLVLARAIASKPRILLIDGLLDGLAPETRDHLLERIAGPDVPWTLVVSTVSEQVAERCESRIDLT